MRLVEETHPILLQKCEPFNFDEPIMDPSLDMNGTDEFLKILNTLSNENIFLISHKSDLNVDKFDSLIRFEKVQNFTKVTT